MGTEYSERSPGAAPLLAVDTGSPVASVAVGAPGAPAVVRTIEQRRSSEALLRLIHEALGQAELSLSALGGAVALAGPGSFTGLRVGLATLLGLHQATGLRATTLETFDVLAAAAGAGGRVLAVVDALRGEWFSRPFADGRPTGDARLLGAADLESAAPCVVSGFGASALLAAAGHPPGLTAHEPNELASAALACALRDPPDWDAGRLARPLSLRPVAARPASR